MKQLNLSPAHPPNRPSKLNFFQPAAAYPNLRLHQDTKQPFRVQQFRETGRLHFYRDISSGSSEKSAKLQFVSQQVKLKKTEEKMCILDVYGRDEYCNVCLMDPAVRS